tara:strand:- start:360 stop:485 length:126 start_codon:yes stop_codon:yes gene_type:complete
MERQWVKDLAQAAIKQRNVKRRRKIIVFCIVTALIIIGAVI